MKKIIIKKIIFLEKYHHREILILKVIFFKLVRFRIRNICPNHRYIYLGNVYDLSKSRFANFDQFYDFFCKKYHVEKFQI